MTTTDELVSTSLTIDAPDDLLTENRSNRMHWAKRAKIIKSWRSATKVLALHGKMPRYQWATVEVDVHQARGVLADVSGGHQPIIKAAIDGLVDARVLPNDTPAHLRGYTQNPPQRGKSNAIVIHLTGKLLEGR